MKLTTAMRRFDEQLRADGKSPITREAYLRDVGALANWLGRNTDLKRITPYRITRYLNSNTFTHTATGLPKAPISLNRSKSAIRTFFKFTVEADFVKRNPARLVRLARTQPKPPRPMSDADVTKLFSTMERDKSPLAQRDYVMFSLMLGTGIRLGALVRLDVLDIDLPDKTIRIEAKGGLEQVVYLSKNICRDLRQYLKRANGTALFQSRRCRPIQARQVQLRFARWIGNSSIKNTHTVHSLRHTFATRLYKQTRDIRLVQAALGHAHVTTTEIYTESTSHSVRDAVHALSR